MDSPTAAAWTKALLLLIVTLVAQAQPDQQFSYSFPQNWGGDCRYGNSQSPINIPRATSLVDTSLPVSPITNYTRNGGKLYNNGYGPEIVPQRPGGFGTLKIDGKVYNVINVHFHQPAEHTINVFIRYALEMHIEHKSANGDIAMLAVFFTQGSNPSSFLEQFLDLLPEISESGATPIAVNLKLDRPVGKYARYTGSLSTPPCTEGVKWIVMLDPITMTRNQLDRYRASFPKPSARFLKPINGRVIRLSP
ncbi:hypothetical protein MPTK2_8g08440 [Marchantia polymorpha subsp. ruderalis]